MYTKVVSDEDPDEWDILDPEGDAICTVGTLIEAECLLSHLNR